MCELTKNIRWKKVLIAGLIYLIIANIIRQIEAVLTLSYYKMPDYFGVWSNLMMPKAGPPPLKFFLISILFSLIGGITAAVIYEILKENLEKNYWKRLFNFTFAVSWVYLVFFILPVYLLFNVPFGLLVFWFLSSILILFLSTMAFVRILK